MKDMSLIDKHKFQSNNTGAKTKKILRMFEIELF